MKPKQFTDFLMKTQNTILSAAFVLAVTGGLNSILGLIKSRILTKSFGVSNELAVFYTAEKIPNLIYSVLIIGAISTVFIPVFTGLLHKDKKKAYETASSIINISFLFFFVLSLIVFIWSEEIMRLLSVGRLSQQEIILGSNLMRIMMSGQILLVAGSLATSILQSYKFFMLPAIAPLAFNIGMISGVIFLSERYGIYSGAYGTLFGSLLHFLIQLPALKKTGFRLHLTVNFYDRGFLETAWLIPPRLISVLLSNIVGTVNNSLAILVSTQSVVYLKLATQLQTLPVSLFGLAMASASLPTLSSESESGSHEKFKKTFITSLHQTMFMVMPLSAVLFVLRIPAVRLVYGVSNFPWEATISTAYILAFYSLSIFSQSAVYLITRAFYALKDTYTPVKVSLFTIFLNVAMSYTMIRWFKFGAEAVSIAFSTTSLIDMALMLFLLHKKVGGFDAEKLIMPFVKIGYSALLMAITLYVPMKVLDIRVLDTTKTINLILLTGIAGSIGMATYLLFTYLLKVEEIELLYKLLRRLNPAKRAILLKSEENSLN